MFKQTTERHLAATRVTGEYVNQPAGDIWFDLMRRYAPDIVIQLYWPETFRNPVITLKYPGVPLRTALLDLCRFCGVEMTINDHGCLELKQPRRVEAMRHAVVIEPDNRTWQKVIPYL